MNDQNNLDMPVHPLHPSQGTGLTKREHAAITLQVPMSNDPEMDAMIRRALLQRFAGEAATHIPPQQAVERAKALLAELERSEK